MLCILTSPIHSESTGLQSPSLVKGQSVHSLLVSRAF